VNTPLTSLPSADYVYLLGCANDTFYVGYTTHLARRLALHTAGRASRYTRRNRPVRLLAAWRFPTRLDAVRAERRLKSYLPERKVIVAQATSFAGGVKVYGARSETITPGNL
jgi:predicted GIY-YIG superfamily endonuclease